MLKVFREVEGSLLTKNGPKLPPHVIWIDLLNPTDEEKAWVEKHTEVHVPSIEALSEIESSSRLIVEGGLLYLSTPLVAHSGTTDPSLSPVGFILSAPLLVTVRFEELATFEAVADRVRRDDSLRSSMGIFTAFMEAIVDRGADVLERLAAELDRTSRAVFRGDPQSINRTVRSNAALRQALISMGRVGDRLSQARDVFLGVERIVPFVLSQKHDWIIPEFENRLTSIAKDLSSLNAYEEHLTTKVQFLLDAILGFINIEQNDLFKVLTIVSVVGIPPTVIVGVYGMNFKFMPELSWTWGYPFGLALVVLSALIPLAWFKWRGWF